MQFVPSLKMLRFAYIKIKVQIPFRNTDYSIYLVYGMKCSFSVHQAGNSFGVNDFYPPFGLFKFVLQKSNT
jgi:hypothetical protein